jgi:hypothetical protein
MHETFLADLTTIEVLRALIDSQAGHPESERTLTAVELEEVRLTLAAADRYIEIANPEFPESDPLFAGHASEAADELPEGLYDANDIAGREAVLFVGSSRLSGSGRAAATIPSGNVDSRALSNIAAVLQNFERIQQPAEVLQRISSIVGSTGREGLESRELLAVRSASHRPQTITIAVIDWSDDPEVNPTVLAGSRSAELVRQAATQVYAELAGSEAFLGAAEFLSTHPAPAQWRFPEDTDEWLLALSVATPYLRVTITQTTPPDPVSPGQEMARTLTENLARREAELHPNPASTHPIPRSEPGREL